MRGSRVSMEVRAMVYARLLVCDTPAEIARETGIPRTTIATWRTSAEYQAIQRRVYGGLARRLREAGLNFGAVRTSSTQKTRARRRTQ